MQTFKQCQEIEQLAVEDILLLLQKNILNGQFTLINNGNNAEELQRNFGDIFYNTKDNRIITMDIKSEKENRYGNFFLETWSNKQRFTLGWMFTLKTDFIFYYFLREQVCHIIDFLALQKWAFHKNRIWVYPEKAQSKTEQFNDTWGRCVPIKIIQQEVCTHEYQLIEGEWIRMDIC